MYYFEIQNNTNNNYNKTKFKYNKLLKSVVEISNIVCKY